jgi:DNA-binding response OmpR family regulator
MPTQPISNPTSRAETNIEASASVTLLRSPQTTRAKPCEHFGRVLLFTNFREEVSSRKLGFKCSPFSESVKLPSRRGSKNLMLNAAQASVKSVCQAAGLAEQNVKLCVVLGRIPTPGDSPEILVVEDDAVILDTLAYNLARQGFTVRKALNGAEALKLTRKFPPDLILLDLMLPGQYDGIQVCEKIRGDNPNVVVIMTTAKDTEEDKVKGFEAGADDYVTKPFGMKELLARINANLKRSTLSSGVRGRIIEAGELWLDTKNYTARLRGEPLSLRLKEFELLAALASHSGELKTREELAKEVWGHAGVGSSRTIDVHIRRLRATLEGESDHEYIHTVRGVGYRFEGRPRMP